MILACLVTVSRIARVGFPVKYPQSSPGFILKSFAFLLYAFVVGVPVNYGVEVSAIDYCIEEFGFVSVEQCNSVAFYGCLGEAVVDGAVGGFAEAFFEEFVVAVVVAEHPYEGAV